MNELKKLIYNESQKLSVFGKIFFIAIIIISAYILLKIIRKLIFNKLNFNDQVVNAKINTMRRLLFNLVKVLVLFIASISILEILGVNTNSLIATAGFGGIALGFGAQYIVRDYISGMIIMAEDQYRVGELVSISGVEGYVEDVGLRLTKLRDFNGNLHIIQNGNISIVTNQSRGPKRVWTDIYVSKLVDQARVFDALDMACEIVNKEVKQIIEPIENLGITNMTEFDAVYTLKGMVEPEHQWSTDRLVRRYAISELSKAGITTRSFNIQAEEKIDEE